MTIFTETNGIIFRIMQHDDIEQTVDLSSQIFTKYEPITKALKVSYDEYQEAVEPYCKKAAQDGLSIVATNSDGEVVGFVISEDLMTEPSSDIDETNNKFEAAIALIHDLQSKYTTKNPVQIGQALHIFLLGVKEEYKNKKIATTLVTENLKLAKSHNFSVAIAEATGLTSQHIFRSLGFVEEFAVAYNSYTFQGEKLFQSINNSHSCILMSSPI